MNRARACLLLAASVVSLSACAGQQASQTAAQPLSVFAGKPVSLANEQGRCALVRGDDAPLVLDMQWPCQFSLDQQHRLRVETFAQNPILMVERSMPMPAPSRDCLTELQAVRQFKGKLEAAPVSRFAMCAPGHWDQKAYTGVFSW